MGEHSGAYRWLVRKVWANHNDSPRVHAPLNRVLAGLAPGDRGLNVGSGSTALGGALVNLDRKAAPTVHCVADALCLPFQDGAFCLVVSQETLEHLRDPWAGVKEMARVLRPGGTLYLQVPFVIGYHPGPEDYWRFTRMGLKELVRHSGLQCSEVQISVGPATGFYRILVEFFATIAARICSRAYLPVKAASSLVFFPLKWLEGWLAESPQRDRIAGGYLVVAQKTE
ncbi:MAG: methyltransferase domain-containing protein [Anaerolineales bacterium]|jgi:SAM-dependent methyltransferase